MKATLRRYKTDDTGTFGWLEIPEVGFQCETLEPPERDNQTAVSCIPAGEYPATVTPSRRFQANLYELTGVPGRTAIRIHAGNFAGDVSLGLHSHSEGCILVGDRVGVLSNGKGVLQAAVLASRTALSRLHAATGGAPLVVEIVDDIVRV